MKKLILIATAALFMVSFNGVANALEDADMLLSIQHEWANVNYELEGDAQEEGFELLIKKLEKTIAEHPQSAEYYVWHGIASSSYAGAKGGLGALGLAKQARKSLEQALAINPEILDGSAYTSLGTLYHKVPGWPLGFGDDDEAKEMLEKAIAINPTGIDSNYFYGEFLFDKKKYQAAKKHLVMALEAPARVERPLADASRRVEIQALLTKVNKKLG